MNNEHLQKVINTIRAISKMNRDPCKFHRTHVEQETSGLSSKAIIYNNIKDGCIVYVPRLYVHLYK